MDEPGDTEMRIRRSGDADRVAILAVINTAALAYRGVIPTDRWQEPSVVLGDRRWMEAHLPGGVAGGSGVLE